MCMQMKQPSSPGTLPTVGWVGSSHLYVTHRGFDGCYMALQMQACSIPSICAPLLCLACERHLHGICTGMTMLCPAHSSAQHDLRAVMSMFY